jgi:hypothetical protein
MRSDEAYPSWRGCQPALIVLVLVVVVIDLSIGTQARLIPSLGDSLLVLSHSPRGSQTEDEGEFEDDYDWGTSRIRGEGD